MQLAGSRQMAAKHLQKSQSVEGKPARDWKWTNRLKMPIQPQAKAAYGWLRQFSVPRKNVQRWMAEHCEVGFDTAKIRQVRGNRKHGKGQGRKLSYPKEVDEKILEWLLCVHQMHLAVSTVWAWKWQREWFQREWWWLECRLNRKL